MSAYNEDNLVQKTTAEYLSFQLKWNESVLAVKETLGLSGTLGRIDEREVVLVRYLRSALKRLNPGLPESAYDDAIRILREVPVGMGLDAINKEKYAQLVDGVAVKYTAADGTKKKVTLRVFDFDEPDNNHFLCVREFWVRGSLNRRRRADVVGFVNGIPLVFMELKVVYKAAVRWSARSIIIAHNHPSGDASPGKDDLIATRQLIEASRIMGISIMDHLVLAVNKSTGNVDFVSMRRMGDVEF